MPYTGPNRRATDTTRDLVIETNASLKALSDFLMDDKLGAISLIRTDLSEVKRVAETLEIRVADIEGWRKWVNGIGAACAAIGTFVLAIWKYVFVLRVGKD